MTEEKVEKSVKVEFEGYVVDLFLCQSGTLGMTVEKAPSSDENPYVDIFVAQQDDGSFKVTNV